MAIDAYAHCGREKYLPVENLNAVMDACAVSGAVLCQHLGAFDNSYIASLCRERPERFAGIALIDHDAPDWRDQLASVAAEHFRGLRVTAAALAENPTLVAAAAAATLTPLIYAPEGIGPLIPAIRELAGLHRENPVVISHLGNPRIENDRLADGEQLLGLAAEPNVYVVLSGLDMFCEFPYAALEDLIRRALQAFGPERIMWGSNFPVCGEDPAEYRRGADLVQEHHWGLDSRAAELITDTTARRLWFR